jgi:hypothetical protein
MATNSGNTDVYRRSNQPHALVTDTETARAHYCPFRIPCDDRTEVIACALPPLGAGAERSNH